MPTLAADRYLCIHGHFYQPPRENPWLETLESQDSASPYHDWNDRVTAECYAPNGAARIVNRQNHIIRILNNYARISYNFGPTLLSWLEQNAQRVYRTVLDADRMSQERFGGHGSAMAQVYNHIILPLASTRDRITQIRWGIADFEHRFGRMPEGMWLPETAVDSESLDLLAQHGIRFVVLAPHQCARIRPVGNPDAVVTARISDDPLKAVRPAWSETPNASVDTTRAYRVRTLSGRSIAVFFYDGPRSRSIAFEGLLNSGEAFASRLLGGFSPVPDHAQLVHVATDGESYGHHHRYGEMALAWMLRHMEEAGLARLTNYGEFLEKFPPEYEAEIVEDSSWSCVHGVERWRADCGCNSGRAGWNQQWRKPLREALDGLRDSLAPLVQARAAMLLQDLDAARNEYIRVVLDRSREARDLFLAEHAARALTGQDRIDALKLMELERHAMLMYTSCGWFFDDISGIETVQIIAYARRAVQLARDLFGTAVEKIERALIERLSTAKSNVPEQKDGGAIYQGAVQRMEVGLEQVVAHFAISSVFSSYPDEANIFCYTVRRLEYTVATSGRGRLVTGRAAVCSNITQEEGTFAFAVLHFGDQSITAVVRPYDENNAAEFTGFAERVHTAVVQANFPEVIRNFDRYFGPRNYSIQSLFKDEQQRILEMILTSTLSEVEASLSAIYDNQASLLHFLSSSGLPRPSALTLAATFAVNAGLRRAIDSDPIDVLKARTYLGLAKEDQVALDTPLLSYLADQRMKRAMVALHAAPENRARLEEALLTARTLGELPFELNLWQAQNIWNEMLRMARSHKPDEEWMRLFLELGKQMRIEAEEILSEDEVAASPALAAAEATR